MTWIAGADGCKKGWFRVLREVETGKLDFVAVASAAELLGISPLPEVLAIDIPIGLPEGNDRECDEQARRYLKPPRASSVFPVPIRAAIAATSRKEASELTASRDGRGVGVQSWALYRKIESVDTLLTTSADASARVREVHPEVSYCAWNNGRAMAHKKKCGDRQKSVFNSLGPG